MERLLRIPEVCGQISMSRSSVYELISKGELPSIRIGTAVRVPANELDAWIRQRIVEHNGTELVARDREAVPA